MTDCLQEQRFELPKFVPPSDQRLINSPIGQWLYNERLKLERDERARNLQALEEGRQEGRHEGRHEGELVGRVKLLQNLNGDAPATKLNLGGPQVFCYSTNLGWEGRTARGASYPPEVLPVNNR